MGAGFEGLMKYDMVMGIEAEGERLAETDGTKEKGLCNAILLSKPYSSFIGQSLEFASSADPADLRWWTDSEMVRQLCVFQLLAMG